jgi:hypothetical protein
MMVFAGFSFYFIKSSEPIYSQSEKYWPMKKLPHDLNTAKVDIEPSAVVKISLQSAVIGGHIRLPDSKELNLSPMTKQITRISDRYLLAVWFCNNRNHSIPPFNILGYFKDFFGGRKIFRRKKKKASIAKRE